MVSRFQESWVSLLERVPSEYESLKRAEGLAGALLCLLVAQVLWLLVLGTGLVDDPSMNRFRASWLVGVGILVAGLGIGSLPEPMRWMRPLGLEPYLVLSRRRGALGFWDGFMVLLGLAAVVGALVRPGMPLAWPLVVVTLHALLLVLALSVQPTPKNGGEWVFRIPEWLRRRKGGTLSKAEQTDPLPEDEEEPIGPDLDAYPVYLFDTRSGQRHPVGVRIPQEVLNELRRVNAESGGHLYQEHPESVILASGPPVGEVGTEELGRLARQISSIAKEHGWTRLETANRVLQFVQEVINYDYDSNSTVDFPGGPFEEYGRFGLETIRDGVGDCECTAILCSALLAYLGFPSCLVFVTVDGGGHVAAGVSADFVSGGAAPSVDGMFTVTGDDGQSYLYGETAVDGAIYGFGVVPEAWQTGLAFRKAPVVAAVGV